MTAHSLSNNENSANLVPHGNPFNANKILFRRQTSLRILTRMTNGSHSNNRLLFRRCGGRTMSHHSDDNMLIATSDSFWEPGNYKKTTKRIEDGYKLCTELITLVNERAEIEKAYAKNLKTWSKKWNDSIEKGPEYGTTEAAWKGVLVEADRRCDLHTKIRDCLVNDVINKIKTWQKDAYHKVRNACFC